MIGYDIDGVFIGDKSKDANLDKYLSSRLDISPIFVPKGKYVLITGRPVIDKKHTEKWVNSHFSENPPIKLYHENLDISSAMLYKLDCILDSGITKFIESDIGQVNFFKSCIEISNRNIEIYHFSELLENLL